MTEAILNERESTKKNITYLLDKLTLAYQNTKKERQEIAVEFPANEEQFSLLEEIELLTVNLRGYASQIQTTGKIKDESQAIKNLKAIRVFHVPVIAQFYFATDGKYEQIKSYIRMLDYLRLLIWEYLESVVVN